MLRKITLHTAILTLAIATLIGCNANIKEGQPSNPVSSLIQNDQAKQESNLTDYSHIPSLTDYSGPSNDYHLSQDRLLAYQSYLDQAIPAGIKKLQWEKGMTWQKADGIYRNFLAIHFNDSLINLFRQHGAYEILVRLHLLSDNTPEGIQAIHYYTQQLIKGKSINSILITYCLKKLSGKIPASEIVQMAENTLNNQREVGFLSKMEDAINNHPNDLAFPVPQGANKQEKSDILAHNNSNIQHEKELIAQLEQSNLYLKKIVKNTNS